MQKLDYLHRKNLNPADQLRAILNALEGRQTIFKKMDSTKALIMLRDLDRAQDLFEQLQTFEGIDLLPEQGRFEAFQARLKKHVGPVLKALGGPAALSDFRPKPPPPRERWWWYMHEMVAANQQQMLRKGLFVIAAILLLISGIVLAMNTILAPSPEALARVDAETVAMDAFEENQYEEGLAAIEKGLSVVPGEPGLLIIEGLLLEALEEEEAAAQSFTQAQAGIEEPAMFYIGRGQLYVRTGQFEKAEQDARAALKADDSMAIAWLLLGQSLEFQGRPFESIPAYEQAGELALASGDGQVVVMARLALGRLTGGAIPQ